MIASKIHPMLKTCAIIKHISHCPPHTQYKSDEFLHILSVNMTHSPAYSVRKRQISPYTQYKLDKFPRILSVKQTSIIQIQQSKVY